MIASKPILKDNANSLQSLENPKRLATKTYLTILFVDVENSTGLYDRSDVEDVAKTLEDFLIQAKNIIEKYNGCVNQTLGDGLYAFFETSPDNPYASSLNACMAAEAMQSSFPSLSLRVGIDSGYVLCQKHESFVDLKTRIVGDTVNTAAHLCKQAQAGTTHVTDSIYEAVKRNFSLDLVDSIKKKDAIHSVYRLYHAAIDKTMHQLQSLGTIDLPFVGRDDLLKKITDKILSKKGRYLHLEGEAGIGKTRLILEAVEGIKGYDQNTASVSYITLPQANENSDAIESFITKLIKLLYPEMSIFTPEEMLMVTDNVSIANWMRIVGFEHNPSIWNSLNLFQKTIVKCNFAFYLVIHVCKKLSLILIFDDIHWQDEVRDLLLQRLYEGSYQGEFYIITSSRAGLALEGSKIDDRIYVPKLKDDDANGLVQWCLGNSCKPGPLAHAIAQKSGNNPYLAVQISLHIKRNLLDPRYNWQDLDSLIPSTLDSLFAYEIKNLSKEEENVLFCCAVIGVRFQEQSVESISNLQKEELRKNLNALIALNIIRPLKGILRSYEFTHALAYDSIYRAIPGNLVKSLHAAYLGHLLKSKNVQKQNNFEIYAWHALQSGDLKHAYIYNYIAGVALIKNSKPRQGHKLIHYALDSLMALPSSAKNEFRKAKCMLNLAKACSLNGTPDKATEYLSDVLSKMVMLKGGYRKSLYNFYVETDLSVRWLLGNFDKEFLGAFYYPVLQEDMQFILQVRAAGMLADLGSFEESNRYYLDAIMQLNHDLERSIKGHLFPIRMICYGALSKNYYDLGNLDLAKQYADLSLEETRSVSTPIQKVYALAMSSYWLAMQSDCKHIRDNLREAYELNQQYGRTMASPFVESLHGYCYALTKDAEGGLMIVRKAIDYMRKHNFINRRSLYHLWEARILIQLGRRQEALTVLIVAKELAQRLGERMNYSYILKDIDSLRIT